ncbi:hypothetical protein QE152_g25345 [Popillia japonica]|uniref:Uncharacterized protein n=1 Tax=Popillia japonica TaxID=7064 RepID=A0AAW1K2E2_POPJA
METYVAVLRSCDQVKICITCDGKYDFLRTKVCFKKKRLITHLELQILLQLEDDCESYLRKCGVNDDENQLNASI